MIMNDGLFSLFLGKTASAAIPAKKMAKEKKNAKKNSTKHVTERAFDREAATVCAGTFIPKLWPVIKCFIPLCANAIHGTATNTSETGLQRDYILPDSMWAILKESIY